MLLKRGANANLRDRFTGDTPLIRACSVIQTDGEYDPPSLPIVRMLLQRRANPNLHNKAGETALTLAAAQGYHEVVRALLKAGANPRLRNKYGATPLQLCSVPVIRGDIPTTTGV
jgi:ankyrin repeat protein